MMTIYSVGDVWYLGKVLDAIAMLTGADGGLRQASAIAALLGVIIICFQSVIKNQGINIQHMVVCYIIYMMCFGFTTNVAIESVYSDKQVIQKDNVPYGPAVMGYVVSQIGYKLTKKMEQAYQEIDDNQKMTNPTSGGYLNALYLIQNLGRISEDGTVGRAINAVDKDFQPNFLRYTSECTTKGMYFGTNKGGMDWGKLQSSGIWDAIKFTSNVFTTEFREHGNAQVYTCTEAHEKLKAEWDNAINSLQSGAAGDEAKNIGIRLGQCSTKGECSNTSDFLTSADASGIRAIFNGQTHAQDFVLAGYADNLIKHGLANGYAYLGDVNATAMMQQAINQRNVQWSAEQNMFLNSVRPMMAFVEGFFYAIAPFASIILMLGMMGLNIFFKYLILLVWVQLWLPVMSIANMFISVKANAFLSNLPLPTDGTTSTISLYVYETAIKGVQDYIAVGGMFMAATPLLTFIIISGSAYAMTSLTGRVSGGDFVNEKMVSPDIASPAAAMSMKSTFNGNPTTGAWRDGISRQINVSEGLNSVRSSLDSQMQSYSSSLEHDWGQAYNELYKHGQTNATNQIKSSANSFMKSMGGADIQNRANRIAESNSLTEGWGKEDYTDFATGASLELFGNGVSANSGFKGGLSAKAQEALDKLREKGFSFSKEDKAAFSDAKSAILSNALTNMDSSEKSASLTSSMVQKGTDLKNLSKQFSEVDSATKSYGNGFTVKNTDLVGNAIRLNRDNTLKLLDSLINQGNLHEEARQKNIAFGSHGVEGESLAKFEAVAQNNKELAGKMYLELLKYGGYDGLQDVKAMAGKENRYSGIVNVNEVGAQSVGYEKDKWDNTKESVEEKSSQANIPNMNSRQDEQKGGNLTAAINAVGDKEQRYNKEERKEMTDHLNNSSLFRKNKFDYERDGLVTREAYNLSKKFLDSTSGAVKNALKTGDFKGASEYASKKISSDYDLNNSKTQQSLADLIGGDSAFRSETGFSGVARNAAKTQLNTAAANLTEYLSQNIEAKSDLSSTEAKEKATALVTNLRNDMKHGNEQGVIKIINEVKKLSD
ncbi:conjugal transfer protein TraG N-terminal domain-containing protein [Succinivibrio dextrinosolvens]|uniref:conjugal transfer protein TraG N-terminal domain-containing protein n=1 Tax=Succinivibrio dextrinosolvens TaxID=83771 RepID=UPI001922BC3F|nr:conjugal transfer protein TraG N-terminal domain-containing protein [Succinivibrio dextrinosolvens]